MNPIRDSSRPAKIFVVLGIVLVVSYFGGCLGNPSVDRDEAIRIAREQIDFVPDATNAELGRQGFPPKAVWAITFWTTPSDGKEGFDRRTAVEIDAETGAILRTHSDP